MSSKKSDQSIYAAGVAREWLNNALEGKENSWIYEYAGLIDDPEVLDWLNYRCSIYADHGEDFLETRQARIVIRSAATSRADEAFREGQASQLQGLVGLVDQDRAGGELLGRVADRLANEGAIGIVFGSPGAGKTATTLDSAVTWQARTGGKIIGNTDWDGFDETVTSDREMFEAMASTKGPVLAILDEIAQDLSGFGAGNKDAETFSDSLLMVRKRIREYGPHPMKGSVLLVGHTRTKTAKKLRQIATFGIEKPSREDPGFARLLDSEGGKDKWDEVDDFKGLTDTALDYDEYDPSEFRIVENDDEGDDEDDVDADDVDKDRQKVTAIRAVEARGMSYPEAAELVDFSDTWVGDRVREWRRGDHRDLVSEDEIAAKAED